MSRERGELARGLGVAVGLAGTVLLVFLAGAVSGAVARSGVNLKRPQPLAPVRAPGEDERA